MADGSLTANLETAVQIAKDSNDFSALERLITQLRQDAPSAPAPDAAASTTPAPAAATTTAAAATSK